MNNTKHGGADLTLAAGQKTILTAELKASESSTFQPKLTTIPNATSAFSGNRLFCAIKDNSTDEFSYHIYDLQPDGSWGEGVLVYEDEAGTTPFPTNQYKSILKKSPAIDISGDYVVVSADTGNNNNSTFFIKKSKTTGKWYCANGHRLHNFAQNDNGEPDFGVRPCNGLQPRGQQCGNRSSNGGRQDRGD